MDHHRDQVGRGLLADLALPEIAEIGGAFEQDLAALGFPHRILGDLDIAGPVGPIGEQAAILPGEVEQDRQHLGGQLDRDAVDPVEFLADGQRIEDLGGARADILAHPHHLARGEGGGDGAALAGVLGPVHRDEHRHLDVAFLQVGDGDAAGLRREDLGQRFDLDDRLVGRDRPIGAEGAVRVVMDAAPGAQLAEGGVPGIVAIQLGPADIERIDDVVGFGRKRSHAASPLRGEGIPN
jgi:hypothetical protein